MYINLYLLFLLPLILQANLVSAQQVEIKQMAMQANEHEKVGDWSRATTCWTTAAEYAQNEKRIDLAVSYYKKAKSLEEKWGDALGLAIIEAKLSKFYLEKGQYDSSLYYLNDITKPKPVNSDSTKSILSITEIENVQSRTGEFLEATTTLESVFNGSLDQMEYPIIKASLDALIEISKTMGYESQAHHYTNIRKLILDAFSKHMRAYVTLEKLKFLSPKDSDSIVSLLSSKHAHDSVAEELDKLNFEFMQLLDSSIDNEIRLALLKNEHSAGVLRLNQRVADVRNQRIIILLIGVILIIAVGLIIRLHASSKSIKSLNDMLNYQNEEITILNDNLESMVHERTKKLEIAVEELNARNEALTQFSYTISHNLRGPLARIMGVSKILDSNASSDVKTTALHHLIKSTKNLEDVIIDLTSILEVRQANMVCQPINLHAEIYKAIELLQDNINESKATLTINIEESVQVMGVPAYVQSILFNLIGNALKYRDVTRQLKIVVEHTKDIQYNYICVSDNGIGIDLSGPLKNKIFQFYQRGTETGSGKGLGLYLVKTQSEAMMGSVSVHSEPDKGSKFTVKLPIDPITHSLQRKINWRLIASHYSKEPPSLDITF